ncbi:hypothetical protein PPL_09221 [Heterostelium album PN500]|uniref:Uncharacterized protein n=1 Tax=Heterostelium pallidum (strain ATCC 26659 / Pp 5 / PN500) TaxID=670386 RepID=D3BKY9_HETP5|nr:hypothetical protein PPL_09221 [Heterostelium album PN500]EFA78569.1 hypothetical protein PPL_09221 [Heterostelium album PN500]|eukprot:XP_020430693.1 hypothetical protein PPL_09221 [Heterostelium album PN500]
MKTTLCIVLISLLLVSATFAEPDAGCPQIRIKDCPKGEFLVTSENGPCKIQSCHPCPRIGIVIHCAPDEHMETTNEQCPKNHCVKNN